MRGHQESCVRTCKLIKIGKFSPKAKIHLHSAFCILHSALPQVGIPNIEQLIHPLRVAIEIQLPKQGFKPRCSAVFADGGAFRSVFAVTEVSAAFIGRFFGFTQVREHLLKRFALRGRLDVRERGVVEPF